MANQPEERFARLKEELADQNERWDRAMRTLAKVGDARITVGPEFFERLDALARRSSPKTQGLRA
jgi:hypothetical protein